MKKIVLIAAIGKNNELGRDNQLLWYLPSDLKFFKNQTLGKTVVMGYNTFVSLNKPLSQRDNVVLTTKDIDLGSEVMVFHSKDELLNNINTDELYIIGGSKVYNQFIDEAQIMLLTEIEKQAVADVFFPEFDRSEFDVEKLGEVSENGIKYKHLKYVRRFNER